MNAVDLTAGVVICAYTLDRWELLSRAVESAREQQPADVVVVIDHNPDLFARAQSEFSGVRVIENAQTRGLSGARNTGVEALDTDIVCFLDDDAHAVAGWLEHLVAPFATDDVGLVGGRVVPEWAESEPSWFPPEFLWVVGASYTGLPTTDADIRNPIGANMAVRRRVFDDVGHFDASIGRIGNIPLGCEETELAIRAGRHGHRVRYAPTSLVEHHVTADRHRFAYFVRRCRAEGMSKAAVSRLSSTDESLSSERSYLTHTIPRAVSRELSRLRAAPRAALGRIGAILAGCTVTAASYAVATVRLRTGR